MGKEFEALTAEQKENFEKNVQLMGLDRSTVVSELRTGATPGPTYLSSKTHLATDIQPTMLTIRSLAELKKLGGIPDEQFLKGCIEEHHEVPPPWPQEKNNLKGHELTPEENRNIRQAFVVQMFGNSESVSSYEKVIDNHHFPMTITAASVEDVTVDPGHPLILDEDTHIYNFGIVTIKKGGQIICQGDAKMNVQKMVKEG